MATFFLEACGTQSFKKITFKSGFEMTIPQNWDAKKATHLGAKEDDLDLIIPKAKLKIKFGIFKTEKITAENLQKAAKKEVASFSQNKMAQSTKVTGKMPITSYEGTKMYEEQEVVMNLMVVEATQYVMLVTIRGSKEDQDKYREDIKKVISEVSYQE
ncbi:hypothetical protein BKI52_36465 [marine bacterium AO1-C]|nr:hypothetical protein BKI52_36465 [marine bacterium AO1-C]